MILALALSLVSAQVGLCGAGRFCQVGGVRFQSLTTLTTCNANAYGSVEETAAGLWQCQSPGIWTLIGGGGTINITGDAGTVIVALADGGFAPWVSQNGTGSGARFGTFPGAPGYDYLTFSSREPIDQNATIPGGTFASQYGSRILIQGWNASSYLQFNAASPSNLTTGSVILGALGSVANASYSNSGDGTTGIYFPTASSIGFSLAGTQVAGFPAGGAFRLLGVADASFVACGTVGAGAFQYGQTSNTLNICRGSSNVQVLTSQGAGVYSTDTVPYVQQYVSAHACTPLASVCGEATNFSGTFTTPATRQAFTKAYVDCSIGGGAAGTGAGTPVITVYDITGAANVGTGNFAASCTATEFTTTVTGTFTAAHKLTLRWTKGACTTSPTNMMCNVRYE